MSFKFFPVFLTMEDIFDQKSFFFVISISFSLVSGVETAFCCADLNAIVFHENHNECDLY